MPIGRSPPIAIRTPVFVLKLHAYLQNLPEDNLVITNIRDVRDALMSYMRFMHVDFETALGATRSTASIADHYVDFPEGPKDGLAL